MNDIREDLKAYLDGELSESRAAEVRAAIEADPELQQEAEFMKMMGLEIKKMAVEPKVEGRAQAVEAVQKRRGWRFTQGRLSFAVQAMVLIVVVGSISAIMFPIFAQSKSSARRFSEAASAPASEAMKMEAPAEGGAFVGESMADQSGVANGAGGGGAIPGRERAEGSKSTIESKPQPSSSSANVPKSSRHIIRNADLGIRVDDISQALAAASSQAEALGGYVTSSQTSDLKSMQPTAFVSMRVPSTRFDLAMQRMRSLGEVVSETTSGEDVTGQVADIGARLKVLRAEEESYVTMLRAARRVGEMLEIKERLSQVRQQIESFEAQLASLKDLSAMSTISVRFEQKVKIEEEKKDQGQFEETWNGAVNGLKGVLAFLGQAVIVLFVYSPIWLPILGIGWWLNRRSKQ